MNKVSIRHSKIKSVICLILGGGGGGGSIFCQILRGKKSVYTDKISMNGRSVNRSSQYPLKYKLN